MIWITDSSFAKFSSFILPFFQVMSAASAATSKSLPTAAAVIQQQQPKQVSSQFVYSAICSHSAVCLLLQSPAASSSSSNPQSTTIQLKDAPAGMKMIPAGAATATAAARILPKGPIFDDVRTIQLLSFPQDGSSAQTFGLGKKVVTAHNGKGELNKSIST